MNKKRSTFVVKDGKGNVKLYYTVKIITARYESPEISEIEDYTYEDGIDINVFDLYEQNENLQHQLEEKDKVIDEAIEYINQQIFDMTVVGNGTLSLDRLLEILERGKNEK